MPNVTIWYGPLLLYFEVSSMIYFVMLSVLQSVISMVG